MTSLLASIAAAGVPSAGLVVIFIVLEAVNLTGPQVELIVGAMLAIELSARHVPHSGQCVQRFLRGGDYCAPGRGRKTWTRSLFEGEQARGHKLFCGVKHMIPFCIWCTDSGLHTCSTACPPGQTHLCLTQLHDDLFRRKPLPCHPLSFFLSRKS